MELEVSYPEAGAAVLRLEGRLNMGSATVLRDAVAAVVGDRRTHVAVDLAAVSFLDSSGLGALISARKSVRALGGDLRISGCCEQVRMVLHLTNLDRVLTPYDSVESALAA